MVNKKAKATRVALSGFRVNRTRHFQCRPDSETFYTHTTRRQMMKDMFHYIMSLITKKLASESLVDFTVSTIFFACVTVCQDTTCWDSPLSRGTGVSHLGQ